MCAIDSDHGMAFANDADLAAWGVTDDLAMRTACDNLARMPLRVSRSGPQLTVVGPDGYISSWLTIRPTVVGAIKDAKVALMASSLIVGRPGKRPVAYDAIQADVAGPG